MGVRDEAEQITDSALMALTLTDPGRFALIFDKYFTTIHCYLARRVGPDVAEDLAGDVFRVAFERRGSFDPQYESVRPWLYGIATNLVHNANRSEQRRLRALRLAGAAAYVRVGHDALERASERLDAELVMERVASAVGELTQGDRDALILFAVEGLSYAEVAAALAVPVGTVRSRISRARHRLRELLVEKGQQLSDWSDEEETS